MENKPCTWCNEFIEDPAWHTCISRGKEAQLKTMCGWCYELVDPHIWHTCIPITERKP